LKTYFNIKYKGYIFRYVIIYSWRFGHSYLVTPLSDSRRS